MTIKAQASRAGTILLILVSCACAIGCYSGFGAFQQANDLLASKRVVQAHMRADMKHDAIRGDVIALILARNPDAHMDIDAIDRTLQADLDQFDENIRQAMAAAQDPAIRAELKAIQQPLADYRRAALTLSEEIRRNADSGISGLPAFETTFAALQDKMDAASADILRAGEATADRAHFARTRSLALMVLFSIVAIGFVVRLKTLARDHVVGPLAQMAETVNDMARGRSDVTVEGDTRTDEIGDLARAMVIFRARGLERDRLQAEQNKVVAVLDAALATLAKGDLSATIDAPLPSHYERLRLSYNSALESLRNALGKVSQSARGVLAGATDIRTASEQLASRTEQQATDLGQASAVVGQVTGMVEDIAKGAEDVRSAIDDAHRDATKGGQVVSRAVLAMDAIEQSSQHIGQIINLIDTIASQTNSLALNAGVEAARAGDAGEGFAVVAMEVRALAQRSADAARDIKALIMTSTQQVEQGVALVGETGDMLQRVITRIGEVNAHIRDIASGTEQQADNLRRVNDVVTGMDRMTTQNASMVEKSTAAARRLANEADELAAMVSGFRLTAS